MGEAQNLIGGELDYAVAIATSAWETAHHLFPTMTLDPRFSGVELIDGNCVLIPRNPMRQDPQYYSPSTRWEHGGPLADRFIDMLFNDGEWKATSLMGIPALCFAGQGSGESALIACMRAIVDAHHNSQAQDAPQ